MFSLLVYHDLPESARETLARSGVEIVRGTTPDQENMCRDIAECDALVAFEQPENGFNRAIIDAGKQLKLIARRGVGYETVDVEYATARGIYVTNTPGINHVTVAEATIMLMLACSRNAQKIGEQFRTLRDEYPFFSSNPAERGFELRGKTLGLIGCGRIGAEVGRIAGHGFGLRVLGYDPYASVVPEPIERRDHMHAILGEADFISLHLPVTNETRGMVGKDMFSAMKQSAFLINTARGALVRERELLEALQSGTIRGAGLDVFAHEPPGEEIAPLFDMENVVLTPHNASFTRESLERAIASVVTSVSEAAQGKSPVCRINDPANPRLMA